MKGKLIEPILQVIFTLMNAGAGDDDEDDDDDPDGDDSSPSVCASQTLDVMAINLPPEKVVTPVVSSFNTFYIFGNRIYVPQYIFLPH